MFGYFAEHDIEVSNPYHGIYYILNGALFRTQIMVTKELDKKNHTWLKALSGKLKEQDMKELLQNVSRLHQKFDRELADSVLEVSIRANMELVETLRGDSVCNALLEVMEPVIEPMIKEKEILAVIRAFRSYGLDDNEISRVLMKDYNLSLDSAEDYLNRGDE